MLQTSSNRLAEEISKNMKLQGDLEEKIEIINGKNKRFKEEKNNKAVCQIRTQSKLTDKIVQNDMVCESCKEKFENDELPKCECGRLKTRYTCDCKEESQEKELPVLPHKRRPNAFYKR